MRRVIRPGRQADVGLLAGQIDRGARRAGLRHRQHERGPARAEHQRPAPFERRARTARSGDQRGQRSAHRRPAARAGRRRWRRSASRPCSSGTRLTPLCSTWPARLNTPRAVSRSTVTFRSALDDDGRNRRRRRRRRRARGQIEQAVVFGERHRDRSTAARRAAPAVAPRGGVRGEREQRAW